jgi:hypothetical protein
MQTSSVTGSSSKHVGGGGVTTDNPDKRKKKYSDYSSTCAGSTHCQVIRTMFHLHFKNLTVY